MPIWNVPASGFEGIAVSTARARGGDGGKREQGAQGDDAVARDVGSRTLSLDGVGRCQPHAHRGGVRGEALVLGECEHAL